MLQCLIDLFIFFHFLHQKTFLCAALTFKGNISPSSCLFVAASDRGPRVGGGVKQFLDTEVQVMLAVFQYVHQHQGSLITGLLSFHQIQVRESDP